MTDRYKVPETRPAVSYGPVPDSDQWVLSVSTIDGERVEIVVGERAMYDLWIEVRGVPWPTGDKKDERLIRQLVHAANGADNEMLEDALRALGVGRKYPRASVLEERKRIAVELAYHSDLTHRDIATIVEETPAWVSKTVGEAGGSA